MISPRWPPVKMARSGSARAWVRSVLTEVTGNIDKAVAGLQQDDDQVRQAQQQQLQRLRYQARLAERQYNQADPDNRLVAAELEKRWESALRELKEAEEKFQTAEQQPRLPEMLSPQEREAFLQAGKKIPQLWQQGRLSQQQKKALRKYQ